MMIIDYDCLKKGCLFNECYCFLFFFLCIYYAVELDLLYINIYL